MPRSPAAHSKRLALARHGTLHSRPQDVRDPLFLEQPFFDPHDLLQVRYEMVRRVLLEKLPIATVARTFGFSRPSFYKAQKAFHRDGLAGLLPAKRGPRRAHKLSAPVVEFITSQLEEDPTLKSGDLAPLIQAKFAITVHPRSIERALQRAEKKTS
ncbi:MAG: helix-turn-helix domain-containing protein [Planctomycetota bacterium]